MQYHRDVHGISFGETSRVHHEWPADYCLLYMMMPMNRSMSSRPRFWIPVGQNAYSISGR